MDILLIPSIEGTEIRPETILGMLWLQTHFKKEHWVSLASGLVKLPNEDAELMCTDAKKAGLRLHRIPALSVPRGL